MATRGTFAPELLPEGWFDETLRPEGWFSQDFLETVAAGGDASGTGFALSVGYSFAGGSATASSQASGFALSVTYTFAGGSAQASSQAPGLSIPITYSWSGGAASASSQASGFALTESYSFAGGNASASSQATGANWTVAYSFNGGVASGANDATAIGAAWSIAYVFDGGIAFGDAAPEATAFVGGGFGIKVRIHAKLKLQWHSVRVLPIKAKLFAHKPVKKIKLGKAPKPIVPLVARVAAQPIPKFVAVCQPVFNKSVVIAKRNAQIEAMLKAAHAHLVDEFWRQMESA